MSWLLNLIYFLLLAVLSPVLIYRMLAHGKYRDGWAQKLLGRLPRRNSTAPCLWFHAVSVGEVLQLQTILQELEPRLPGYDFVITTTTVTGLAVAREKFSEPQHHVCYFPLDFSWAVNRALDRIRPSTVVLVELELWPNFIMAVHRRKIPLALVNGRISENSFRGYRRIRPLMQKLLIRFDTLAVQNEQYRRRLIVLGAPRNRIVVTGSVKFDGVQTDRNNPQTLELRTSFGIQDSDRVFIAGSTQAPEEQYALDTWLLLRQEFPELRLILVPRHQERFDEVAALVKKRGLSLVRRTETYCAAEQRASHKPEQRASHKPEQRASHKPERGVSAPRFVASKTGIGDHKDRPAYADRSGDGGGAESAPILLLDTLGELNACWGLANIAFVGGSLTRRGGQNMIEPSAYGAAVLFGQNTNNFRDVVDLLLAERAARVVVDSSDLTRTVRSLLSDRDSAEHQGKIAQRLVLTQQGATKRTAELIVDLQIPHKFDPNAMATKAA